MREVERARLRQLVFEFSAAGRDLGNLPLHKAGIAARLRELGRELEASSIEAGAGFSLVIAAGGQVEIISGGRREPLLPLTGLDLQPGISGA